MRPRFPERGQSAVEFVLIAPWLFLFFFCVIQTAYMAFVALAVQRSALAIARAVSLGSPENSKSLKAELAVSLLPISNLSRKTLLTVLETRISSRRSPDHRITVQVEYPMPVWVPFIRNIFGQPLIPSKDYQGTPEALAIDSVFRLMNISPPDFSFTGLSFPVRWITFQESVHDEGSRG